MQRLRRPPLSFRPFRCTGRLIGSCLLPSATGRDGRGLKMEALT